MFAILITNQNMPKIVQEELLPTSILRAIQIYLAKRERWYLIRGYVTLWGNLEPWALLPAWILERRYDIDPDKIKTEWSQIVRKESP